MDFIICGPDKMEQTSIPESLTIDFDIGDTNDVQITCERGMLDFGMYLICPGTEYGALIEEVDASTDQTEETWMGNSFRKFLQQFIVEPKPGDDYRIVSGDAHDAMREILSGAFDGMFTIPEEDSGIDVGTYQFERYTDALTGFTKMLKKKNARVNIEIKQGGPNEAFYVVLSATPIRNLSEEIEYSQDSKISINLRESRRGINHLICLGTGNLKDRQVVHLYAQFGGSISQTKKYYTGLEERTATYDYNNAESLDDLIEKGTEQLEGLMDSKKMTMSVQDIDMQIGDIIAGRNYDTGFYMQKPITEKIIKVENGMITVDYKVEGED